MLACTFALVLSLVNGSLALKQIVWENRSLGDVGCICKVTVDGTKCPIEEPQPFDSDNFSFKCDPAFLE